jgi:AraC-like DNA-binding protein
VAPVELQMNPATERHYSVSEIAALWGLSVRTITRMLEAETGILRIGQEGKPRKRRYMTLRVPESVLCRIYSRLRS